MPDPAILVAVSVELRRGVAEDTFLRFSLYLLVWWTGFRIKRPTFLLCPIHPPSHSG